MRPSQTYTVKANTRCIYRININKDQFVSSTNATDSFLRIVSGYSDRLHFYRRDNAYPPAISNNVLTEWNARFLSFLNDTYVLVFNRGTADVQFTTQFVDVGFTPLPPGPPPSSNNGT